VRILYLEDEPADAQLVERYARLAHHEITVVKTVEEARDKLDKPPDLILVDILLNQSRGGYQFVSELRDEGYTEPIIAVTGLALPHEVQRCYELGFTEVLTKPYTIKQLGDVLNRYTS
jgi:CheY-like chemotaxis protein